MTKPRNQLFEPVDRATATHSGKNGIAMNADLAVLNLEVEAAIEIERGAVFVELGPDPGMVEQDEVDLLGAGQHRALKRRRRDALGPLLLDPFDLGDQRPRPNRHAQHDLVLDDQPGDGLRDNARLGPEQAQQQRHDAKICPRSHRPPVAMPATSQQAVECAMNYHGSLPDARNVNRGSRTQLPTAARAMTRGR